MKWGLQKSSPCGGKEKRKRVRGGMRVGEKREKERKKEKKEREERKKKKKKKKKKKTFKAAKLPADKTFLHSLHLKHVLW